MAGRDLGELVQTIIVAPASHEETVWCAAAAAGDALLTLPGPWEEWLSGPSTKTVRRVKTAEQLDKAVAVMAAAGHSAATVACGGAVAAGFAPILAGDVPKRIARLQVSGLDVPPDPDRQSVTGDGDVAVVLVINPAAAMTTGKTAAQAAHALVGWLTGPATPTQRAAHADRLATFELRTLASPAMFDRLALRSPVTIRDAGRTEIQPGTRTVCVMTQPEAAAFEAGVRR